MPPSTIRRTTTDRKSTRLNSSHLVISYAVFCLKKGKLTQCHWADPQTKDRRARGLAPLRRRRARRRLHAALVRSAAEAAAGAVSFFFFLKRRTNPPIPPFPPKKPPSL